MIKVFNGSRRTLGGKSDDLYMQLSFSFREKLHHFKGAKLAVFMAICLHSDQDGKAFPSYTLLEKETGFDRPTIAKAISELCAIEIDGSRVLCRYQDQDSSGRYVGKNNYIILPSADEALKADLAVMSKPKPTILPRPKISSESELGGSSESELGGSSESEPEVDPLKEEPKKEEPKIDPDRPQQSVQAKAVEDSAKIKAYRDAQHRSLFPVKENRSAIDSANAPLKVTAAGPDKDGQWLRVQIQDAGFTTYGASFMKEAAELEETFSTEQLIRALQNVKEVHAKKIESGEKGIWNVLSYMRKVLLNPEGDKKGSTNANSNRKQLSIKPTGPIFTEESRLQQLTEPF